MKKDQRPTYYSLFQSQFNAVTRQVWWEQSTMTGISRRYTTFNRIITQFIIFRPILNLITKYNYIMNTFRHRPIQHLKNKCVESIDAKKNDQQRLHLSVAKFGKQPLTRWSRNKLVSRLKSELSDLVNFIENLVKNLLRSCHSSDNFISQLTSRT